MRYGTGAPGGIRTPNPQIRSLVLCPIELRAHDRWREEEKYHTLGRLFKVPNSSDDECSRFQVPGSRFSARFFGRAARGDVHVDLDSATPCRNDVVTLH